MPEVLLPTLKVTVPLTLNAPALLPLIPPDKVVLPEVNIRFRVPAVLPIAALIIMLLSALKVRVGEPLDMVLLIALLTVMSPLLPEETP